MEKEISSGTLLGIVLIALAVIISLGFGIFSIAKGTANEGVAKVQTNLANVQASEFTDYDQTVVTGTQAKSAISNFEGKSVAILIATSAWKDYDAGLTTFSGTDEPENLVELPDGSEVPNYNALLKAGTALEISNGKFIAKDGFEVVDGAVQFDNNIGDMNKSGMTEFINAGAKFNANLIQDASGTTMGIIFQQIGN